MEKAKIGSDVIGKLPPAPRKAVSTLGVTARQLLEEIERNPGGTGEFYTKNKKSLENVLKRLVEMGLVQTYTDENNIVSYYPSNWTVDKIRERVSELKRRAEEAQRKYTIELYLKPVKRYYTIENEDLLWEMDSFSVEALLSELERVGHGGSGHIKIVKEGEGRFTITAEVTVPEVVLTFRTRTLIFRDLSTNLKLERGEYEFLDVEPTRYGEEGKVHYKFVFSYDATRKKVQDLMTAIL